MSDDNGIVPITRRDFVGGVLAATASAGLGVSSMTQAAAPTAPDSDYRRH